MILKPSTAELSSSPLAHAGFYQLQNQSALYFKLNTGTWGNVIHFELEAEIWFTQVASTPLLLHCTGDFTGSYWYRLRYSYHILMTILSYRVFPTQPVLSLFLFDLPQLIGTKATSEILSLILKLLGACTLLQFTCSRHQPPSCDSKHLPTNPFSLHCC